MSGEDQEIPEYGYEDAPLRDGIGEEDHAIPRWFQLSFYATIAFAAVYVPFYMFSGWSSASQWAAEVERAELRNAAAAVAAPKLDQNPYRDQAAAIEAGKEIFVTTCAACHKPDGSGLVGPSLVDPYWKYGRGDPELYETVAKGRPLGMPPWAAQLGDEKIWKVLAYMETLPQSAQPGLGAPAAQPGAPEAAGAGS